MVRLSPEHGKLKHMNAPRIFEDRVEAGASLASLLQRRTLTEPCVVLALPRGGLPVAAPVARRLGAHLDVMTVRKIGWPADPERAIGAVAPGTVYRDESLGPHAGVDDATFQQLADLAEAQRRRREHRFRMQRAAAELRDATVILVDDGIATGATMIAAVRAARQAGARKIVAAAPVASFEAVTRLRQEADEVVVLQVPSTFHSVAEWYRDFPQVEDEDALGVYAQASG